MDLWTITLTIVAISVVYYYFKKKLSYFKDHGVPYEPGLPIFGNMFNIIFQLKSHSEMMCDIYKSNPDAKYVGAFNFGRPVIILRDPELIKTVTIKNFDHFPDRSTVCDEGIDPFLGGNLFHIKGERWREARVVLSRAFTSSKMKSMFKLMEECGKNFKKYMSKLSDEERKEVATKDLFTKYTTDVIATCAFGLAVDSLQNPDNEFYVLGKRSVIFEGWFMIRFYMSNMVPSLMKFFNIRVIEEDVARFFKGTVSNVIETRVKQGISRHDMIQLMMEPDNTDATSKKFDVDEITAQAFGFFLGGFDTTSTQMCIISHELAMNPDIQRKLQDEIDRIMKETNGEPTYEALQDTPYFDAVYAESLRRHTDFVVLDRMCEKPLELPPSLPGGKPFVVKPGMAVWISGKTIHMDSKHYKDPKKFNPDRYHQKKININDELNLSFGIGPRGCLGFRFAILETKVLFFHLLSKFNLVANEETRSFSRDRDSLNVKNTGGFNVSIERRSCVT